MFEKPKLPLFNNKREKVDKLADGKKPENSSVYDLAKAEDEFRIKLKDEEIVGEVANRLADRFSDETLGKMEAQKESLMDALTGIKNKRAFQEDGLKFLSLAKREGSNCSLLMLDFDHFKEVNDKYGHSAGDMALKTLAEIMKKGATRPSDLFYRYGGEEFAVLLPGVSSNGALIVAEKIRMAVENAMIPIINNDGKEIDLKKTVSVGIVGTDKVADFSEENKDIHVVRDNLIKMADIALYNSKKNGRNQSTVYEAGMKSEEDKKQRPETLQKEAA